MAVSSLESLCAGFCELARVPAPTLNANEQGLLAFSVAVREVTVDVLHCPDICPDHAFVLFQYGESGHDGAKIASESELLLQANFLAFRAHPAVFSRNPDTGQAMLQYVYPFRDATAASLFDLIDKGVDSALEWRRSGAVRLPEPADFQPHSGPPPILATFA